MKRRAFHSTITLAMALTLLPVFGQTVFAETGPDVTFELRPHCEEQDHAAAEQRFGGEDPQIDGIMALTDTSALPCPGFAVRDPLSRQTDMLHVGDTLDMDLILHNPSAQPLKRFRAWIAYDSTTLEGVSVSPSNAFPIVTPGEMDFSVADNYIKLSGTAEQAVNDTPIVVARIVMTVKSTPQVGAMLSFHDASGSETARTGAFVEDGPIERNVSATIQGSLSVRFQQGSSSSATYEAASRSSSAPAETSSSTSSSSTALPVSVFTQLQVMAVRVTTEGSSAFLAWNPLPSTELAGYNIYYGSISGRYLQRRSVQKASQTLTIRALPVGQTTYFALRAVNASGEESDFSQEVAVTIGNPATSTSPLSGALIEGGPNGQSPETDGSVAGASGPGTWLMLIVALSAITGTVLAFRRQWTAIPPMNQ